MKISKPRYHVLLLFAFTVALPVFSGCAATPGPMPVAEIQAESSGPEFVPRYVPPAPSEGSLWTESGNFLFVDKRARRVGDTLTVDIIENSTSNMDVNTETTRDSNVSAGIPNLFGVMKSMGSHNSRFDPENMISANITNEFKGEATSDRSGMITASIGARVTEVLPNGNLVIFGKREMQVNNETQFIVVSGVVRPVDITPDNRVKSTYLADSRIEYNGQGVLAEKQKPGWGTRVLDHVWPF
jgi:flagellar L-ring protein precursor FlgH